MATLKRDRRGCFILRFRTGGRGSKHAYYNLGAITEWDAQSKASKIEYDVRQRPLRKAHDRKFRELLSSQFTKKGWPDTALLLRKGQELRLLVIEVKFGGDTLKDEQILVLRRLAAAGSFVFVLHAESSEAAYELIISTIGDFQKIGWEMSEAEPIEPVAFGPYSKNYLSVFCSGCCAKVPGPCELDPASRFTKAASGT